MAGITGTWPPAAVAGRLQWLPAQVARAGARPPLATPGARMSSLVHTAHAVLGWLALAEGVAAFLRSSLGWARRRDWTPLEDRLGLA
ncbi:MAG TPA: hypothetical protein VFM45_07135, partial [Anaeromyxobacteraceae bacterium]|nr:hypothetical protein [Anaeromyxobacteraceae bacterium]